MLPVNYQQEVINTRIAEQIINQYDVSRLNEGMLGKPISLVNAIANANMDKREVLVDAYWNTYDKYLRLRFAQDEAMYLRQLERPTGQADQILLNAARLSTENKFLQAEVDLQMAQGKLEELFPQNPSDQLPLPKDRPLLGTYNTNYEALSGERSMTNRQKSLHMVLPRQYQMIHAHARSIQVSRSAVSQTSSAYNSGSATLAAALQAIRVCSESQSQFAHSLNQYNHSICEYAMSIAPYGEPHTVAGMLIKDLNIPIEDGLGISQGAPQREARNDPMYSSSSSSQGNPNWNRSTPPSDFSGQDMSQYNPAGSLSLIHI